MNLSLKDMATQVRTSEINSDILLTMYILYGVFIFDYLCFMAFVNHSLKYKATQLRKSEINSNIRCR